MVSDESMCSNSTDPQDEFVPTTQAELSRFVGENAGGARRALYPVGGRTALNFGYPSAIAGTLISTADLTETIDYPARDMTVTVEAGMRMDELTAALKQERQQLPVDVSQSRRATVGGVIATNTSGPRRLGYGTLRDYVIGISAVDAGGRLFSAGGRVVKNVAGYDLCKLMVGSLGTLAIITQVTFKLRPLPETSQLVVIAFSGFDDIDVVLARLMESETRPVALEVLNSDAAQQIAAEARQELPTEFPLLCVGFEGSERETNWQVKELKEEIAPFGPQQIEVVQGSDASRVWAALTEYQTYSDDPLTFQANLLPSRTLEFIDRATDMGVAVQSHAGNGIVIGHLPDDASSVESAAEILTPLRKMAQTGRGNLVVFNCEAEWKQHLPVFGEREPSWPLMQQLKMQLDPHGLLNPGRFVDSLECGVRSAERGASTAD